VGGNRCASRTVLGVSGGLVVIETHPVQYHAPVYRAVQAEHDIPVTAIYASDFSVKGYRDAEFGATFAWDTDLLSGYTAQFLSRVDNGGARNVDEVSARGLAAAVASARPRAVMVLGYSPAFNRAAAIVALRSGVPVLFRGETTDRDRRRNPAASLARDLALRAFYSRCARLLFVGARSRDHFDRLGVPAEKLVFSPYCVDNPADAPDQDVRAELGIPRDAFVLLYSGKLSARKGVDLLIPALRGAGNVTLLLVGDGERRDAICAETKRGPAVDVRAVGFKNQGELGAYFQAADALVLPSIRGETWGLVVNEAMHHGLPCVVSDAVGCQSDLVIPAVSGEVCEAGSVESLAAAIVRVRELAGRPGTADRCRRQVEPYSVQAAAAGIAKAYSEVT